MKRNILLTLTVAIMMIIMSACNSNAVSNTNPEEKAMETAKENEVAETDNSKLKDEVADVANADEIAEIVWTELIENGYSEIAAAGVMGNIYYLSEFSTDEIEYGIGLCQWAFKRRAELEDYAELKGVSPESLETQMEYLLHELETTGFPKEKMKDDWKNARTVEEAATAFENGFIRAKNPSLEDITKKAEEYYKKYA